MKGTKRASCALLLMFLPVAASAFQNPIQIKGSDTLIFLGQRLAQIYKRTQPSIIEVRGGNESVTPDNFPKATDQILQSHKLSRAGAGSVQIPIAVEGIVVYVNQSNPVSEITLPQLRSIFQGEITNWKALGGRNERIALFAGESSTGILDYFQDAVLKGEEPYPFEGKSTTKDLLELISQKSNAIGYSSIGQSTGVRALKIRADKASAAVDPSATNIRSRVYPISRYVYWYVPVNANSAVKAFCAWSLSSEGQLVVESVGFQPLMPADRMQGLNRLNIAKSEAGAGSR